MPCIGQVIQEYSVQAYPIDGYPNFNNTSSYQKIFSSVQSKTRVIQCVVLYYVMQMLFLIFLTVDTFKTVSNGTCK